MNPAQIQDWCLNHGYGKITASRPVGGGCINHGARISTSSGASFFLKTNSHAPQDMFLREAEGLRALQTQDGPAVPQVYAYDEDFILMQDLAPASPSHDYWPTFGRQLAALHGHTRPAFGFDHDNYIGNTPQPNAWSEDGYAFFGQNRLIFQAGLARNGGYLDHTDYERVEKIVAGLPGLIPEQPASLIHGDLWSGNALTDFNGQPALIDPAAHYGWGEAELGMTALFGAFPDAFYRAYQEIRPLTPGWQSRLSIYNLYHLLNHVNLFGAAYLSQVHAIIHKYA